MNKTGKQWTRVTGPNLDPTSAAKAERNKTIRENPAFKEACERAEIPVTKRQASKWAHKRGSAYAHRHMKNVVQEG